MNNLKNEVFIVDENKDKTWFERSFSRISNDSLRGSILILIMTALGTGVFSLHHCFALIGIYNTCTLILFFGFLYIMMYKMLYFIKKIDTKNGSSISEGINNVGGTKIGLIYNFFVLLYLFLCAIPLVQAISKCIFTNFYSIIIKKLKIELLDINQQEKYFNKLFVFLISPLLFFINYQRNIENFKKFSIPSFIILIYIFILIICQSKYYHEELVEEHKNVYNKWNTNFKDFMLNYSIVLFSYNCSINYYSIFSVVKNPNIKRMNKISIRTIFILMIIFIVYGIMSYISIGTNHSHVSLFIFRSALKNNSDILMIIGRSLLCISLIIGAGLNVYPLKMNTLSLFKLKINNFNNLLLTSIYTLLIVIISAFFTDIKFFISLAGSLTGTMTAFTIPGIIALYYGYSKNNKLSYLLWFFIILVSIAGIYSTILLYIDFLNI